MVMVLGKLTIKIQISICIYCIFVLIPKLKVNFIKKNTIINILFLIKRAEISAIFIFSAVGYVKHSSIKI